MCRVRASFLFATLLTLSGPFGCWAADGFFVKPTIAYLSDNNVQSTTSISQTRQMVDLSLGWLTDKGWMYFLQYGTEQKTVTTTVTGGSSTDNYARTSLGPGIGWRTSKEMGPYVMITYYLQNRQTLTDAGESESGAGYQLDFGYLFEMKKNAIMFQLTYRHFDYTAFEPAGFLVTPQSQTNIDPGVGLLITF